MKCIINNKFASRIWIKFISPGIFLLIGFFPSIKSINRSDKDVNFVIKANDLNSNSYAQLFIKESAFIDKVKKGDNSQLMLIENAKISKRNLFEVKFSHFTIDGPKYAEIDCQIAPNISFSHKFIVEPGDSITFRFANGKLGFSGRNVSKYNCQQEIDEVLTNCSQQGSKSDIEYLMCLDSSALESISILGKYKHKVHKNVYLLMKMNIIQNYEYLKNGVRIHLNGHDSLQFVYANPIWNDQVIDSFSSTIISNASRRYSDFMVEQYEFDNSILPKQKFNLTNCYQYLAKNLNGMSRELALMNLIRRHSLDSEDKLHIQAVFDDAVRKNYITTDSIRHVISDYVNNLTSGKEAFNFVLPNAEGKTVRLSDYYGKLVLLDFYSHSCGACRMVHPIIEKVRKQYSGGKLVVVSIFVPGGSQDTTIWERLVRDQTYSSINDINLIDMPANTKLDKASSRYKVYRFPTLIFISKNGTLIGSPFSPLLDNGADLNNIIQDNL
ncbi:TlpA disulfide reductase family protein [Chitinophaga sp. S165]|uniref:TlpA family protein disulfide reductase n=1 Tax=Chitinophaga sp. S165 TaxID=2135462 RepID=UPI000D71951B|nr:TlpA disulfide reductase family protein [Chitinophaga sp. S165]PWV47075.1 AhpC/TSA family protein [Chitinophaga sp. S165]